MRSFQVIEPGVFTSVAPMLCPGSHTHSAAPVGSAKTAMRPTSITSNASAMTLPPLSLAFCAAPAADATVT